MGIPGSSGDRLTWAHVFNWIRCSFWCSFPLAVGSLAVGYLILLLFEGTVVAVAAAMILLTAGLLIMGMRSFAYVQQVEPQYWQVRRPPPHCCQSCEYDLTGNVSGVCPECGGKI